MRSPFLNHFDFDSRQNTNQQLIPLAFHMPIALKKIMKLHMEGKVGEMMVGCWINVAT